MHPSSSRRTTRGGAIPYGRFLSLEPDRLVEMTWLNAAGTRGAETVLTIELNAVEGGTQLRLTHRGLPDEESRKGHEEAWRKALKLLDQTLSTTP